jgi:hypothetical protein
MISGLITGRFQFRSTRVDGRNSLLLESEERMPTYRTCQTMKDHEKEVVEQIESLGMAELHLWPNLNDFRTPEIDLFLIHERMGPFVVEMKSHTIDAIQSFNSSQWRVRGLPYETSPVNQVRKALEAILKRFSEMEARPPFVVPTVLWSAIDRREWEEAFREDTPNLELGKGMLFRDDLISTTAQLEAALRRAQLQPPVGSPGWPEPVTTEFLGFCKRYLSDGGPKLNIVADRERLRHFENKYENEFRARVPIDRGTRLILEGAPGTGKTWALMAIAWMHAEAGKKVLFLCYNKVLRADLARMLDTFDKTVLFNNLEIRNIFEFLDRIQSDFPAEGDGADDWASLIAAELSQGSLVSPLYDLILVDEAQDMKDYVEPVLQFALAEGGSVVLGLGTGQELYENLVPGSWLQRFQSTESPILCDNVYRTPEEIFFVAQAVRQSSIGQDRITADIRKIVDGYCRIPEGRIRPRNRTNKLAFHRVRTVPVVESSPDFPRFVADVQKCISQSAKLMPAEETRSNLLLLVPSSKSLWLPAIRKALQSMGWDCLDYVEKSNRDRTPEPNEVRLTTYHSARGIEAHTVILFDLNTLYVNFQGQELVEKLLYIGLTRCRSRAFVVDIAGDLSLPARMLERLVDDVSAAVKKRSTDGYRYSDPDEPGAYVTASIRALESPIVVPAVAPHQLSSTAETEDPPTCLEEEGRRESPAGSSRSPVHVRIKDLIAKWFS